MIRALGWTLLHFVWQGAVVAALLASLNLALRRATPQARYLAACASLLLMLALPALTFRVISADRPNEKTVRIGKPIGPVALEVTVEQADQTAAAAAAKPSAFAPTTAKPFDFARRIEAMLPALVTLWIAGVLLLGMRSLGGLTLVRRLERTGLSEAPAGLADTLARLAQALRVSRAVRLYESALVGAPTVVGWFRPVILLPASALTGLTAQQLELILAHELAHVRRHDYLVNLLQSAAETLLFYHPAVWWVSNRMRAEREHCCDDLAVSACGSAVRYARALVKLENLCSDAPTFAITTNGGSLFDRIVRLVGRAPEPSRAARGFAALAAVASLALAFGFGSILLDRPTPTIVDVLASSQSLEKTAPLAAPVAIAQADSKPQSPTAAPGPQPQPAAAATQQRLPQAQPAATARAEATPQARAFPLELVLEMARAGITPEYVDEMDALGYKSLNAEQLIALRHQGVGPQYVKELAAAGYKDLSAEQLMGLRAQGVSAGYAKELREQGLSELSLTNLIALRSQGVTPKYVEELKAAGHKDLSVTSLIALRSQGVSGSFVAELKALGYDALTENQLIALRSQGVSPGYVRELGELGYRGLDMKMLVALRSQGVNPDYVRELKELGYGGLEPGQLIELRAHGVTPSYVHELKEAGFEKLTVEELVQLRSQGVSPKLLKSLRSRKQP
jgi:beta-lactamase regulating signal transducer with metallopeptidase domain